ncbi:MAG: glycoside hydrolase family 5 protein [Defluviitaleaceae bacterium]|nr:glycoside hydrolase family 5 protein [Defluviitaleaceae bacterium]
MDLLKMFGTGWNLGNTLDSLPEKDDTSPKGQETSWHNPMTTHQMLKKVHEAGFSTFRVPVSWCTQVDDEFNIKKEWLLRVKEVVDYGYSLGMTVIMDLHHEDWHFPTEENYPSASKKIKKIWSQLSDYFGDYSHRLIFESMNEPRKENTPIEWIGGDEEGRSVVMKLNQDFVDTVRASNKPNNATRPLLVPNYAASTYEVALADFVLPKGENIIMSLHAYEPYDFALGDDPDINDFADEDKKTIDELFEKINKHILSKGIPVIIGECGARKKGDNEEARTAWASYYTKKAREYGVPCVWWDNGIFKGGKKTEIFGLLNRHTLEWTFPKIVNAFVS